MTPFVPFPNAAQVELLYVLDGQVVENRLWFWNAAGTPGTADLVGLADGVYDWHTTYVLPYLSDQLQLATVVATDWSTPGNVGEVTTRPPINGGVAENPHSANVAVVVGFRWPNNRPGLKRNKHYVPGVPLSQVDINTVTPAFQDLMFEAYAALIDLARVFYPGDYWYWVVASAWLAYTPRSEMVFGQCIGPVPRTKIKLGQRRKRLPAS